MNAKKSKKLRKIAKELGNSDITLKDYRGNTEVTGYSAKPLVLNPLSFKYINKVLKKLPRYMLTIKKDMLQALVLSQCEARKKELHVSGYKL